MIELQFRINSNLKHLILLLLTTHCNLIKEHCLMRRTSQDHTEGGKWRRAQDDNNSSYWADTA